MAQIPSDRLVTIYGGSGFVGRHLVRALAKRGWRIRVAVRRPDLAGHLQPLGVVGQIQPVQANLRYPDSVARTAEGASAIVNLVGILYESGAQTFDAVQAEGAASVAKAAKAEGARLVQMSAIGADKDSASGYGRSKALGEAAVFAAKRDAIVMRPSIIFGPEDDFFNRFASLARISPFLPLIGGGETKFQPVFVGDVAEALAKAVEGEAKGGEIYELGGPEVKSFRALMELTLQEIGRKRILLPLPFALARLQAFFMELLPKPMLTRDQVTMLQTDNVVSDEAARANRTLEGLGINLTAMRAILPSYLWRYRKAGQFTKAAT
ncbi:MAG: complex I NDUFA9 subunit family protein [Xanthobacteraceae bacterium]|nr:complex I NDUFA9 subunit family protein [Xanthobacteraceae bacterium]MCW5673283.1 complex I NDUFA9 subunit family protein [Xanthobacteraceae bacterium]